LCKLTSDVDGFTGECTNHLNDGKDCDGANCGRNKRLVLKRTSGNDGVIQFLPKMTIPARVLKIASRQNKKFTGLKNRQNF